MAPLGPTLLAFALVGNNRIVRIEAGGTLTQVAPANGPNSVAVAADRTV